MRLPPLLGWGTPSPRVMGSDPEPLAAVPAEVTDVNAYGIASGGGVSVALVVAIFASNLPEAIGSASDMRASGRSSRSVLGLWAGVAVFCAAATVGGAALSDVVSSEGQALIDGFAAGALLTMLIDSMVPEAREKAKDLAGLATVVGFAVAAGLSLLGQ